MKKYTKYLIAGAIAFMLAFVLSLKSAPAQEAARFDFHVRNDFFAGFSGNMELLDRGMAACEKALAENPKNPEALVWHGAGLYFKGGQAMQHGDQQAGMPMIQKGIAEMDRAVELAPDNIGVRIPRGAVLLTAAQFTPPQFGKPLVERGISDYQRSFDLQKTRLMEMGSHPRGELLSGLALGNAYLGNTDKAEEFFLKLKETNPNSPYSKRADKWLQAKTLSPAESRCIGCHVPGK
ncbi:MAG: hypothetical protein ABI823_01365 [Bryobacteraceae bacterium]